MDGRKPYPERKSCGFKSIRIRAEGASNGHYHRLRPLKKEPQINQLASKCYFSTFHDFSLKQVCKNERKAIPMFYVTGSQGK